MTGSSYSVTTRLPPKFYEEPVIEKKAIPKSITEAICKVQISLEALKKENRNAFAKYMYVSADDMYAALTRKLASAGLVIIPTELEPVRLIDVDGKAHAYFHYGFTLACGADTYSDPSLSRSMFIQITGPQTFGSAESYLQKTFLRGLFKIPTGEHDLDEVEPKEPVAKKKPAKFNAEESKVAAANVAEALASSNWPLSPADAKSFVDTWRPALDRMTDDDRDASREMFKLAREGTNDDKL